jgi:hypothetical protein
MRIKHWILGTAALAVAASAPAAWSLPIMLEGTGGGGINPWALISNGGKSLVTPAVFGTYVTTGNYNLFSTGVNLSISNYAEIYYDHQYLGLPSSLTNVLGGLNSSLGVNSIEQNIIGAKVQVYPGSGMIPAIALGINGHFVNKTIPHALGANANGVSFYGTATGIYPLAGSNLLLSGDIDITKANYMGLLGFGGPGHRGYTVQGGVSAGYFVAKDVVVGAEWRSFPGGNLSETQAALRTKTGNSGINLGQSDWYDGFVAYMPNPHLSVVAAIVSLGNVVNIPGGSNNANQNGFYLNVNGSF